MNLVSTYQLSSFVLIIIISCVSGRYHNFEEDITLNEDQKRALEEFKDLVSYRMPQPFMKEDIHLLRWLRSRQFNVRKAEAALIQDLKWREDNNMDSILEEDFSDFEEDFKIWLAEGTDKRGKPIFYFDAKTHDTRKAVLIGKSERYLRYVNYNYEMGCNKIIRGLGEKYGNVTRGHLIINADGYNIVMHGCLQCVPVLLRMITSMEAHWPGCIDQFLVLNAPAILEPLLQVIRPAMTPELRDSFVAYGTNRRQWQSILEKEFLMSELPPTIGGSKIYSGMEEDFY